MVFRFQIARRAESIMKTILIFEPLAGGHREGYIRWLSDAFQNNPPAGFRFVFLVDSESDGISTDEVLFRKISSETAQKLAAAGRWARSRILWKLFSENIRKIKPDHALILELTHFELPLALFGSPCPVSAILFVQYPELPRRLKFFFKHWKTRLLLRRAPVKNLFLLNGEKSCSWLSARFGSRTRFFPVPDPATEITAEADYSLRQEYHLESDRTVFLFFGAISPRKGSGVLIEALHLLTPDAAAQSAFIFCGQPESRYRRTFEQAAEHLRAARPDITLNIENRFVSDERMIALFEQSDVVLMPYTRPEYSSGILALAAKARTPVIGPDGGLLGRLILQNGLGAVCSIQPAALAKSIADAAQHLPAADEALRSVFVQKSCPEEFVRIILNAVKEDQ